EAHGHVLGDGQRQAGLAHAAGTGQGQEGDGLVQEEGSGSDAFAFAPDEAGAGDGQGAGQGQGDSDSHAGILVRAAGNSDTQPVQSCYTTIRFEMWRGRKWGYG